jgi:hypothetical protein
MPAPLRLGFKDYEQTYAKKRTRRQRFLDEMNATLPWEAFLALIQPIYHQPTDKGGRPPFLLEMMLRIHLLQQWFTLSDPLMEEMLIDTPCFRRFAGIDMIEDRIRIKPRSLTSVTCWKAPHRRADPGGSETDAERERGDAEGRHDIAVFVQQQVVGRAVRSLRCSLRKNDRPGDFIRVRSTNQDFPGRASTRPYLESAARDLTPS